MTTHLGSFGTERDEYSGEFDYFGETVRVHPNMTDLALIELAEMMTAVGEENGGIARLGLVKGMLRSMIHPDDLDRMWKLAVDNRQTIDDVMPVVQAIIVAAAERPTKQPSDSSDGLPTTAPSSTDDSSSRALRLLEGRPDLQVAVLRAREARTA
jgi:hypothetical protein